MNTISNTFVNNDRNNRVPKKEEHNINEKIRAEKIRLISDSGEQLGVLSLKDALAKARAAGLDLIEISPDSDPPVCKILDYGKFKYQKQKQFHEARKKQKVIKVKDIFLKPMIEEHDYQVKLRQLRTFIEEGDKVRLTLRFRGRQIAYKEQGKKLLERFIKDSGEDLVRVELAPKEDGASILAIMVPATKN